MLQLIPTALDMENLGGRLAQACPNTQCTLYLQGPLGSGKTTLVRGFLRTLGYTGPVKSPTYTLIEPYTLPDRRTYHLDLYRLHEPEELEYLGLRDYLTDNAICLIEWPEQGITYLPPSDLQIQLSYYQEQRLVEIQAHTSIGQQILQNLKLHHAEVQNEVLNN